MPHVLDLPGVVSIHRIGYIAFNYHQKPARTAFFQKSPAWPTMSMHYAHPSINLIGKISHGTTGSDAGIKDVGMLFDEKCHDEAAL